MNTSSNPPSASDHPVIRAALLRDFYDHFETKFAEIWKLIKGGTDKSLVGALSKDDVALRIPAHGPFPDWLISGGESGGGARPVKRRWIRDVIADCRQHGIAPFHKQWGSYQNNPLVVEQGMSIDQAKALDKFGKGGGLVDGELVREFPVRRNAVNRDAA